MSKTMLSTASIETIRMKINKAHKDGIQHNAALATCWVFAGQDLRKVKAGIKHGEFQKWVGDCCDFSHRTATLYMKCSVAAEKLLAQRKELNPRTLLKADVRKALEDEPKRPRKKGDPPKPPDPEKAEPKAEGKKKSEKPQKLSTGERVNKIVEDGKEMYGAILNDIQRVRRDIKQLATTELGLHIDFQRTDGGMVTAYRALKFAMPFARCCYCAKSKGKQGGCRACEGKGWLSQGLHRDAPAKMKEMAAKGGSQ